MALMQFGVNLPQIKRSWQETRAVAEEIERLGFHSVWFNDHLYGIRWYAPEAFWAAAAILVAGVLLSAHPSRA